MRLAPALAARQTQRQAMSPRLAQAIGMLALDAAELEAVVADHMERNPLLVRIGAAGGGTNMLAVEAGVEAKPSLRQHLLTQIGQAFRSADDAALAASLADELDDAGYLRADPAALARRYGNGVSRVERVLARCRSFEPVGLFARDLADCLALQLEAVGELDEPMRAVLCNLSAVARADFGDLVRLTGMDAGTLRDRLARLRRCDPKPGAGWSDPAPSLVRPVARAAPDRKGRWRVTLLSDAFPLVRVDHDYAAELAQRNDARGFALAARREARWLERALRRRMRTVHDVAAALIEHQRAYVERGERELRPLTMTAIAARIGVHETTVGRAIADKAIELPRGTIALRSFFASGVDAADGPLAARAVSRRIEALVAGERADGVLSDERLARLLRADGVEIARRTVAKYRRHLSIGSSAQRRRALAGVG